ncbi:zinc-binding dehydrogenase [Streptomyces sp. cf386]|uniref:zinc-binding dehydrogenase n=1 Tax=Streptomyces sp. cf386 TaxID=1761904 RepID=UPI003526C107
MTGVLKAGETFLMHGGAGGTGTMAIQIAKACGARVVTTVGGPEQAARVRDLGADLAIDHRNEDFAEHGPYDVILDVIGGHYLQRNVRSLALEGRRVVIGLQNGLEGELNLAEFLFKRASVHGTTLRSRPTGQKAAIVAEVQDHVWPLIENGSVQVVIDTPRWRTCCGSGHVATTHPTDYRAPRSRRCPMRPSPRLTGRSPTRPQVASHPP